MRHVTVPVKAGYTTLFCTGQLPEPCQGSRASSFYLRGRFSRVPESLERKMIVLGGSASIDLAGKVAKTLNAKHGELEIKRFPDGEKYVRILDDVKDQNVVAVQSLYRNPDEYIMELLLLVDALRDLERVLSPGSYHI